MLRAYAVALPKNTLPQCVLSTLHIHPPHLLPVQVQTVSSHKPNQVRYLLEAFQRQKELSQIRDWIWLDMIGSISGSSNIFQPFLDLPTPHLFWDTTGRHPAGNPSAVSSSTSLRWFSMSSTFSSIASNMVKICEIRGTKQSQENLDDVATILWDDIKQQSALFVTW